jgi:hypothetical protein
MLPSSTIRNFSSGDDMKRTFGFILGTLMLTATAAFSQETPKAEFSTSYSYLRLGGGNGINQQGGSVSIAGNLNHWFAIVGDFGAYRGQGLGTFTFLVGPRFSARNSSGVTPFAQVLFGGAHLGPSDGVTPFAISPGGGLDVKITPNVALRPQVDYLALRANGQTLNSVRASVGLVFRFGVQSQSK